MKIGDRGDEVLALQQTLDKEGFHDVAQEWMGSDGAAVGFGEVTASAVTAFQEKYKDEILTPIGLQHGTGYVGPLTRKKLNALYGCGIITLPKPQILSPNGGEQWQKGTVQKIQWTAPTHVPTVSISLEPWYECLHVAPYCALAVRSYALVSSTQNDGVFEWAVGRDLEGGGIPAGQYTVTVYGDNRAFDSSDKPFSIVAAQIPESPTSFFISQLSGSDSNDGSQSKPSKRINAALSVLRARRFTKVDYTVSFLDAAYQLSDAIDMDATLLGDGSSLTLQGASGGTNLTLAIAVSSGSLAKDDTLLPRPAGGALNSFGGMYGYVNSKPAINPATGASTCPVGQVVARHFSGNLTWIIRRHSAMGLAPRMNPNTISAACTAI